MTRKLPVWLLGLSNAPLGITGAVALLIAPQVLAARHVPESQIANITTLGLASGLFFFLAAPVLDVHFSRRTYAIAMSIVAGVMTVVAVLNFSRLDWLGPCLFLGMLAAQLNFSAIGGWFGSVLPSEYDAPLGAWMTIANAGGFGITSILGILLIHHAPLIIAAIILGALNLIPLLIIFGVDPPGDERRRMKESFGRFGNEIAQLAARRDVRRLLLLFALPCASFALTNTLGGLGADYHASEKLIAAIAGVGVTLAGIFGSLSVPVLSRRAPLVVVYLSIGIVGGLSTIALLVLPHTPAVYTFAFVTQNIWQSAALATGSALALASIGKDNPLASTQFAFLTAALTAPIVYMQWLDGHAYAARGLTGLYLTDGGLDLLACTLMVGLTLLWSRQSRHAAGRVSLAGERA
ncbi:MAG TPA: MFS transporter [Sphingomicrobium sp.]|nr:MFS transporter [Sphingomicrobium sp.]